MFRRLFLFLCLAAFSMPLQAAGTACLSSSLADLWKLAGGSVDITVQEAVDRGFASPDAIIVDSSSGRSINSELIISADPDLTIGSVDTLSHVRLKGFMDGIGKRMLLLCLDSFGDFLSAFRELTEITGRDDLYEEYGTVQKEEIERIIADARSHEDRPCVLFIRAGSAFSSVRAKRTDDHFAARIISDLGAVNAADSMDARTETLSLEALVSSDIDMILVVAQGDEEASLAYVRSLFSEPGWRDIPAVRSGSVHYLPKELFHYKPCSRWAEAYRMMEEILYG